VTTSALFFPFDLFGSRGAGAGAELLADALREMLADNRRETQPTRAAAYTSAVRVRELTLETLAEYQNWRDRARRAAELALRRGDFLLWVAGNHLGVLPVFDALAAQVSSTLVVQLDAHLDVYNLSDCTSELSHGNFLLHVARPLPQLINLGHRELVLTVEHIQRYYQRTFPAAELALDLKPALRYLRKAVDSAAQVFLDIDCDVLDPSCFPAVSHSLPFGLMTQQLLQIVDAAWSPRLVGVSLSEFVPARDRNDQSLSLLVWFLEYLLLKRYERLL
jgi:arginase family enzyme